MELFYAHPKDISGDEIVPDPFECQHIQKTLKKQIGDHLLVTDGLGNLYHTRLQAHRPKLSLHIERKETRENRNPKIALAAGFIRPNRLEFILEKGTELGVGHFILLRSRHANYTSENTGRFTKIIRQAMKQSLQTHLPDLSVHTDFRSFLEVSRNFSVRIAATNPMDPPLISRAPQLVSSGPESILIAIGPEGGFSEPEQAGLNEYGFSAASLGPTRLRTETAALSAVAVIQQFVQSNKEAHFV